MTVGFETGGILFSIQVRGHNEAGFGVGIANEAQHFFIADQRFGVPVLSKGAFGMKKTKHAEVQIIGAVKQLEAACGKGSGPRDGSHRPDAVQLDVEVPSYDWVRALPSWTTMKWRSI